MGNDRGDGEEGSGRVGARIVADGGAKGGGISASNGEEFDTRDQQGDPRRTDEAGPAVYSDGERANPGGPVGDGKGPAGLNYAHAALDEQSNDLIGTEVRSDKRIRRRKSFLCGFGQILIQQSIAARVVLEHGQHLRRQLLVSAAVATHEGVPSACGSSTAK